MKEIVECMQTMPWLKPKYVMDNKHFTGQGPSAGFRLGKDYALIALGHLKEDADEEGSDEPEESAKQFEQRCGDLKVLAL